MAGIKVKYDIWKEKSNRIWNESTHNLYLSYLGGLKGSHSDNITDFAYFSGDLNVPNVIPVLTFDSDEMMSLFLGNKTKNGEIEFGEYPQEKVSDITEELELETMYLQNKLPQINETYTFLTNHIEINEGENREHITKDVKIRRKTYTVYKHKNEKYIRLNYGGEEQKKRVWIKITPVKWELDKKKRTLTAKKALLSAIDQTRDSSIYSLPDEEMDYYSRADTQQYVERYFLTDLMKSVNKTKIVRYNSFVELKKIIRKNGGFRDYAGIAKILFIGPKLNFREKIIVQHLIPGTVNLSFNNKTMNEKGAMSEKEAIKLLVKEIDNICERLPKDVKYVIDIKVNTQLKSYIIELEEILNKLLMKETTIKFLEELAEYKELLDSGINSLTNETSTDAKIQNIIYMSSKLDKNKSTKFLNVLSKYINEALRDGSLEITNLFEKTSKKFNIDYENKFREDISNLFDEVNSEYKIIAPYIELLECLNVPAEKCEISGELIDTIRAIKYIISERISNVEHKKVLEEKLGKFIEKYTSIINNIISSEELLQSTDPSKIKSDFIVSLYPILVLLGEYANLEEYELRVKNKQEFINKMTEEQELQAASSKKNLLSELQESIKIVKDGKAVDLPAEKNDQKIISFVVELNNRILSPLIDEENKQLITDDLLSVLKGSLELLEKKDIRTLSSYQEQWANLVRALSEIENKMKVFEERKELFDRYTKK